MPFGDRTFQIDFDFIDHMLIVRTGEGEIRSLPLVTAVSGGFLPFADDATGEAWASR